MNQMSRMSQISRWAVAGLALAVCGSGCGGGEEAPPGPSGPPMQPEVRNTAPQDTSSNRAPRIQGVRFEPASPTAGQPVRARVDYDDPDGNRMSLRFDWSVNGARQAEGGPKAALAHARKGDLVEVTVVASDGLAESEPFVASTRVRNAAPQIRGIRIEPAGRITAGIEVTASPQARDPDGDPISFEYIWWVNGSTRGVGPTLSTEWLKRGDRIRVGVVASDGDERSERIESAVIPLANAAPIIVSQPGGADEDGVFRYRAVAEDPDDDLSLRFRLVTGPEGMTVSSSRGEVVWKPTAMQAGTHPVEIVVEDLQGGRSSQRFEVIVGARAAEEEGQPPADLP